jgi:hypothetical protein
MNSVKFYYKFSDQPAFSLLLWCADRPKSDDAPSYQWPAQAKTPLLPYEKRKPDKNVVNLPVFNV